MTGTGAAILAAILLGCFWMPHPVRNFVRGYSELKEAFFRKNFGIKCFGSGPTCGTCFHVLCPLLATYFATPEMSETLGISGVARAEH